MWLLRMTAHALADSGAGETPLMPLALLEEAEAGGEGAASLQVGRTLVCVGWCRGLEEGARARHFRGWTALLRVGRVLVFVGLYRGRRRGRGHRIVQVGPTLLFVLWPPGCKTRYSLVLVKGRGWEKGDAIVLFAAGERR